MGAAGLVDRGRVRVPAARGDGITWLARLLLVAVAFDLVFARVVVRLAIFIPKEEPLAAVSAALGRLGAAADALVPLAGLLLLGGLLAAAGRTRDRGEAAVLAAVAVVAAAGFALLLLPPSPAVLLVIDLLVAGAAIGCALRLVGAAGPVAARAGVVATAAAVATVAISRTVGLVDLGGGSAAQLTMPMAAAGQVAFVAGAGLIGIGGLGGAAGDILARRRALAVGTITGLAALTSALLAPAAFGALAIWSIGVAGAVPPLAVAVAIGLVVAGLPGLHRDAPALALGAAVVLLAGYGLASSGLLLASLLGLMVAGTHDGDRQGRSSLLDCS